MNLKELYKLLDNIGVLTFSTIYNEEIHSRSAHFNGYDKDGLYFRTMDCKPFYKQLIANQRVTVCGISNPNITDHDDNSIPVFPTSYTIRIIGKVRNVSETEMRKKAEENGIFLTAVNDMDKYPAMKNGNFVIYAAKVEIFDVDFEKQYRDHKLLRTRFSFGDYPFNNAGPTINNNCVSCNKCYKACTFDAIEKGNPYKIISNKCDDCGDCMRVCPVNAITPSLTF